MKMRIAMIRLVAASLCVGLTAVVVAANAVSAETADYVFKNGAIYTIDGKNPKVQAIAIKGKHISLCRERQRRASLSSVTTPRSPTSRAIC